MNIYKQQNCRTCDLGLTCPFWEVTELLQTEEVKPREQKVFHKKPPVISVKQSTASSEQTVRLITDNRRWEKMWNDCLTSETKPVLLPFKYGGMQHGGLEYPHSEAERERLQNGDVNIDSDISAVGLGN